MSVIGIVASGAGGVEQLRVGLVEPLVPLGHTVAVTLTPTAARWLEHIGEIGKLEAVTGLPVRAEAPPVVAVGGRQDDHSALSWRSRRRRAGLARKRSRFVGGARG
jgi:hypothetical protein